MRSQKTPSLRMGGPASELLLSGPHLAGILREVLAKGIRVKFRARGFSMSPFIKDGDVVSVSPLAGGSPGFGDVIVFSRPRTEQVIVHRVVGKKGDACLARGDSNFEMDGWVPGKDLLGRVTGIEREGKRLSLGLGPERFLLAFLTRLGLLKLLLPPAWRLLRPFVAGKI